MRVVIKIGSNILSERAERAKRAEGAEGAKGLNQKRISSIASVVVKLRKMGHEAVIVSSGAVAAGMGRLGLRSKPSEIMLKQAVAAIGQPSLMRAYEKSFKRHGVIVAQILLTRDGLENRTMYINAKNTMLALLAQGAVPVVNENDTVATEEIRFGDNDQLAALVAALLEAERLVILSDVDGLYDANPATSRDAKFIERVDNVDDSIIALAGGCGSTVSTGGMYSKLLAAKKATHSGIAVNIINGRKPSLLISIMEGRHAGTEFTPSAEGLSARKGWITYGIKAKGTLVLDAGAVTAVTEKNKSLLPSGILDVKGNFEKGDAVECVNQDGRRVAKGLANYSSVEVDKIKGLKTTQIEKVLGYRYSDEVIHRDNMVTVRQ